MQCKLYVCMFEMVGFYIYLWSFVLRMVVYFQFNVRMQMIQNGKNKYFEMKVWHEFNEGIQTMFIRHRHIDRMWRA